MKCPRCGSEMIRELRHKTIADTILRTIGYGSYKCQVCGEKFRTFGGSK